MNQKAIIFLPIFFLAFAHSGSAQSDRFIVNIVEYRNSSDYNHLCSGTIITSRHVLTTAACASTQLQSGYSLSVRTELMIVNGLNWDFSSSTSSVNRVFIHPDYRNGQNKTANIAVIHTTSTFRGAENYPVLAEPRLWGNLSNSGNENCRLFGWGGAGLNPNSVQVQVQPPQSCDPSFPQVFCSSVDFLSDLPCQGISLGSPVVCNNGSVNGVLIGESGCALNSDGRVLLSYHSVGNFSEWIQEVSGAEKTVKTSLLVLSVVLLLFKNLM